MLLLVGTLLAAELAWVPVSAYLPEVSPSTAKVRTTAGGLGDEVMITAQAAWARREARLYFGWALYHVEYDTVTGFLLERSAR
jgi:hypothetical protein